MKRLVPTAVLLALFEAVGSSSAPVHVRVLTYNIHHGEGTDGRFDLPRLAALIMSAEPDLVALQEVDQRTERAGGVDQLAELERLTGMYGVFGKAMDFQGGGYGVAVLSRQPILRAVNRALPDSPDREPRTGLTVDVQMDGPGTRLQFTSTHLDQGRDLGNRVAQATFLNTVLASDNGTPSILAGDMNSRPDTEVMQTLAERWTRLFAVPELVAPSGRGPGLVDHVLVRPASDWHTIDAQVIDNRIASDHRPVLAVLEWTPNHAVQNVLVPRPPVPSARSGRGGRE